MQTVSAASDAGGSTALCSAPLSSSAGTSCLLLSAPLSSGGGGGSTSSPCLLFVCLFVCWLTLGKCVVGAPSHGVNVQQVIHTVVKRTELT